ncbi:hypothetical protein BC936DRAFT_142565 [Jimgerdemannia flammicorona]|uniref:Uncharacterized protein n=1 Tax=Jimgerdemannia flammicorona TaxID=994334 RepID=A0A433A058_9FUNG|nr:hypothetical protein BC936DRAFT_142565 [Jimgerdemannia flammicorona]
MVHTFLTNLPQNPKLDADKIVARAVRLEKRWSPLEVQKRSGIWLDDWSPVNTYDAEWHNLAADQHPDRIAAERYLSMPPRKRELWEDEVAEMVAAMGGGIMG